MLNEARVPVTQQKAQSDQYYSLFLFIIIFFIIIIFYAKVIPPISYLVVSKILITDITYFKFHTPRTICKCACENEIKTSNILSCQRK
jgi:c-di-AMP phosphodiesterase-like protein